jgi:4-hydroxy-2-oxoglutarate aldolase
LARYNLSTLERANSNQFQLPRAAHLSRKGLCGVLLPITTPFRGDASLDAEGLAVNIQRWNQTGISGYVVLGSTGERSHLDEREYIEVIETARQSVPRHLAFIAGAGQQSTRGTISEIKRAAAVGADAVLVLTPHFYRNAITSEVLVRHYREIADASTVPVILYSMPALTGIKIAPETIARLGEHQNIIGIKDSSADIAELEKTINGVDEDFAVFTGNGTVFYEGLRAGACGGILAVGCAAPALCLQIFATMEAGEMERAELLQATLSPLAAAVTTRFGIGGLKAALDIRGYIGGLPRAPLQPPDEAARQEIRQFLEEADNAISRHEVTTTTR